MEAFLRADPPQRQGEAALGVPHGREVLDRHAVGNVGQERGALRQAVRGKDHWYVCSHGLRETLERHSYTINKCIQIFGQQMPIMDLRDLHT